MRRIVLTAGTALATVACALLPSAALAHGHHRHHRAHGARHHGRQLFAAGALSGAGAGAGEQAGASGTAGTPPATEHVTPPPSSPQGNAGTVVSFTEGMLTIKLGEGENAPTVSGKVTEETEIHCIPAAALTPPASGGSQESGDDDAGDASQGQQQSGEPGATSEDDQGAGDDQDGGDRNLEGGEEHSQCSATNLTQGTVVHSAELRLEASGAVFREIVLVVG